MVRVVLSTIGVFHSFALARELERHGCLTRIFSGYPAFKLKDRGVSPQFIRTFPWIQTMVMKAPAWLPEGFRRELEALNAVCFDRHVSRRMEPCDAFIGLSGSALNSGKRAQQMGARYICDRGSTHIAEQDRILREEFFLHGIPFRGVDRRTIEREQSEYEQCDLITVPSHFVQRTFASNGISSHKVRVVPYGVDLSAFRPVGKPPEDEFRVLFVGSVNLRKGFPYLVEAYEQLTTANKRLDVVGGVHGDVLALVNRLRSRPDIVFHGHQPQDRLREIMSASSVMVLPSIEEGLAMVQAQALACGCPVISTCNSGAEDLFSDQVEGFIVEARNPAAIASRLQQLADSPQLRLQMSAAAIERVHRLGGWEAYGLKMLEVLNEVMTISSVPMPMSVHTS
jgi:glycosyltransferase involved in cell wall biosynthesis